MENDNPDPSSITPEQSTNKPLSDIRPTSALGTATTPVTPVVEAPAEEESTPPADKAPTFNEPAKMKKKASLAPLLIIALVAALVGGGYWWHIHQSKNSVAATAAATKKDIPNIRYVTTNEGWDAFYPAIDNVGNYLESNIMIFEGLVRFENKTQIVPLLSTGWTNPDTSTWVFNLRQDVYFHDGNHMTAQDVKLSFDAAKDSNIGQIDADTIASVAATGPYQVTIKTNGPDATLLKKLTNYYVYDTKSGKQNDPVNGSGPFTIKPGTTAAQDSLELVAFDKYYGGRPHVRSFSLVGLSAADHGKAYGEGKASLVSRFDDNVNAVNGRKYTTQKVDPSSVFVMILNPEKVGSPLAKLPVRQAIQLALDPLAIAKVRNVEAIPATQVVPSSILGYDPTVTRPARNTTTAKQLLTNAGYPNGFTFKLTYYAPSQTTGQEIAKELAEAGIKVTLDPRTDIQGLLAYLASSQLDATFDTQTSDIFDASDILVSLTNSQNFPYKNQAVTDLLAKSSNTLDTTKRLTYLKQASHVMATDLGVEPVYVQTGDTIYYDPSYVITRDVSTDNLGIYFQKVYAK